MLDSGYRYGCQRLRGKCPYYEIFWYVFSPNAEK